MAIRLSPLDPLLALMRSMRELSFGIDGDYATASDRAALASRTATSHSTVVIAEVAFCLHDGWTDAAANRARVVREVLPDMSITLYLKL